MNTDFESEVDFLLYSQQDQQSNSAMPPPPCRQCSMMRSRYKHLWYVDDKLNS